eukprot:11719094-Alexandrium_andersonii.AAC.1
MSATLVAARETPPPTIAPSIASADAISLREVACNERDQEVRQSARVCDTSAPRSSHAPKHPEPARGGA